MEQEQINKVELLKDFTNEENALIVENYPYGFRLKTKIKYWIETNKNKGDRFVSQTLNPKTNLWNKPKYSVYNAVMVMFKDLENSHIHYFGLWATTDKAEIKTFLNNIKDFELNDLQKEQLRILKAYSKAYENVTFEIKEVTKQTEEERLKEEEKQKQVKKDINKIANYHYLKDKESV